MPSQQTGILIIFFLGMLAVAVAVAAYVISRRRLRTQIYGGRKSIGPDEFVDRYFDQSSIERETVTVVLNALRSGTPLDFSRVNPDEPLDERINELLTVDDWEDVQWEIEEELGVSLSGMTPITSIRQLISAVRAIRSHE